MTIERPSSHAPGLSSQHGSEHGSRHGSAPERGVDARRGARLRVALALGGLLALMVFVATWLTFFHSTSSLPSMNMEGATMGPSVCGVLPPGVIDQALGQLAGAPASTSTRQTTTCRYRLGGKDAGLVVTYAMNVSPQSFTHSVSSLRAEGAVSPIAALGPEAYGLHRSSDGRTTVVVRHHGNVIRLETTAPLAAATRLATIAAPQL